MIQQKLNEEVIKRFKETHSEVVTYFKYTFPPKFAKEIHKGNCSLTFTKYIVNHCLFEEDLDLWDVFLIIKALGYKVEFNNTVEMSFTIRF